jgi:hypothetical protein
MLWFFLLLAVAIAFLAVTNRIDDLDGWLSGLIRKARAGWDYAREDVEDIEHELREKVRPSGAGQPVADADERPVPERPLARRPKLVRDLDDEAGAAAPPARKPRQRRAPPAEKP